MSDIDGMLNYATTLLREIKIALETVVEFQNIREYSELPVDMLRAQQHKYYNLIDNEIPQFQAIQHAGKMQEDLQLMQDYFSGDNEDVDLRYVMLLLTHDLNFATNLIRLLNSFREVTQNNSVQSVEAYSRLYYHICQDYDIDTYSEDELEEFYGRAGQILTEVVTRFSNFENSLPVDSIIRARLQTLTVEFERLYRSKRTRNDMESGYNSKRRR